MHRTFLDVPVDGLVSDDELVLDLDAIGQPGPLEHWSVVTNDSETHDGVATRKLLLVDQLTQHEVSRVFAKQPLSPGDTEGSWRRVE